jgi:hypothetical protein
LISNSSIRQLNYSREWLDQIMLQVTFNWKAVKARISKMMLKKRTVAVHQVLALMLKRERLK